jgi:hypothetical protein
MTINLKERYIHNFNIHKKSWNCNTNEGIRCSPTEHHTYCITNAESERRFVLLAHNRWRLYSKITDYHNEIGL